MKLEVNIGQGTTGKLSESRVYDRLISLGLNASKPIPDRLHVSRSYLK
jgi:hypothetical protein